MAVTKQVMLQKIHLKDASLEVPQAPQIYTRPWQPQVDVQLGINVQNVGPDQHQVVLTITVTAKLDEDVAYLVEVEQAGVFLVQGVNDPDEHGAVLGAYCPNILFPYAREAISDLVARGGFPQLLLQPVNFETLYHEHLARRATGADHPPPS